MSKQSLDQIIQRASSDARFRALLGDNFEGAVRPYDLTGEERVQLAKGLGLSAAVTAHPMASAIAGSAESSAVESSAVESSAVESSAVESSAVESSAVESSAVESSAVESSAVESSAVESSAVESS